MDFHTAYRTTNWSLLFIFSSYIRNHRLTIPNGYHVRILKTLRLLFSHRLYRNVWAPLRTTTPLNALMSFLVYHSALPYRWFVRMRKPGKGSSSQKRPVQPTMSPSSLFKSSTELRCYTPTAWRPVGCTHWHQQRSCIPAIGIDIWHSLEQNSNDRNTLQVVTAKHHEQLDFSFRRPGFKYIRGLVSVTKGSFVTNFSPLPPPDLSNQCEYGKVLFDWEGLGGCHWLKRAEITHNCINRVFNRVSNHLQASYVPRQGKLLFSLQEHFTLQRPKNINFTMFWRITKLISQVQSVLQFRRVLAYHPVNQPRAARIELLSYDPAQVKWSATQSSSRRWFMWHWLVLILLQWEHVISLSLYSNGPAALENHQ